MTTTTRRLPGLVSPGAGHAIFTPVGRAGRGRRNSAPSISTSPRTLAVHWFLRAIASRSFVGEHKSGLILSNQGHGSIAGRLALRAVDEDRDGQEVVADRQFAAGEDRAGRDGELVRASLAAEHLAGLARCRYPSSRSGDRPARLCFGPADQPEGFPCLLIRHAGHGR